MSIEYINDTTTLFTDKGSAQALAFQSAANAQTDPSDLLCKKYNYTFAGTEAQNDYIAVGYLKKGADILWHNAEILANDDADAITGELGILNPDGTFENKATFAAPTDFVGTAVIPEPHEPILDEARWVVFKITNATPPTAGQISFYLQYIALS